MEYFEPAAPLWQTILGLGVFAAVVVGPVLAVRWASRRRARGEEAGADTTKGAESMLFTHGRGLGG
jgi:hypothetical protein